MARPAQPWFYAAKNTWYVWDGDKKVSLGVKGRENKSQAMNAWHVHKANGSKPTAASEAKPESETKPSVPTVAEVVAAFLADAKDRLKPGTVKGYRDFLDPYATNVGDLKADRLTPSHAQAYARKSTWSKSTQFGFLTALAVAFRWAERASLLAANPLKYLHKPAIESRGESALISLEDHQKLISKAAPYFRPFLELLYFTGARPGEVAAITMDNFDEAHGLVKLKEHKTARHGKPRLILLCPQAVEILRKQKAEYGSGYLLRNRRGLAYTRNAIIHMMASLRKKAGVDNATAYGYRHTWATDGILGPRMLWPRAFQTHKLRP
jgi:integrase